MAFHVLKHVFEKYFIFHDADFTGKRQHTCPKNILYKKTCFDTKKHSLGFLTIFLIILPDPHLNVHFKTRFVRKRAF